MTSPPNNSLKKGNGLFYSININNKKFKFNIKSFLLFMLMLVFIGFEIFFQGGYVDEVFGIASLMVLLIFIQRLNRNDLVTLILLLSAIAIGIISNLTSGVSVSKFSIFLDALTQFKVILAFYFIKSFFTDDEKRSTVDLLLPLAKLFCIASFICAIASQFVDLGMAGEVRYGLNCFNFIFTFNFEYIATYMLVFACFICTDKLNKNQKLLYYFMSLVAIVLNLKSEALIFTMAFIFLFFYFRKHQKLNIFVLLLLVAGTIFLGQFQIDNYLAKEGTARHEFFVYALKNANDHFPFGSGFATYGSAEASKNYSPLYYEYGFNKVWGMSPDFRAFLTDTYWASVIGQFGWIGTSLIVVVYTSIFFTFTNNKYSFDQKAFLYAAFAQYVIHAIGSGIITSSSGMIGFIAMAIACQQSSNIDLKNKIPTVKFSFRS